jgi:hypothetical protein
MIDMSGFEDIGNKMNDLKSSLNDSIIELQKIRDKAKSYASADQLKDFDEKIEKINIEKKKLDAINNI